MNIAVLIPDRGDRPEFLKNCLRMINNQTLKPVEILIMNDPPTDDQVDITKRYRLGYQKLSDLNTAPNRKSGDPLKVDLIAFIENDDWYAPNYLEVHAEAWNKFGQPIIFGTNYTIYYHLKMRRYYTMYHEGRSSAMNTFLKPNMNIDWGKDENPYTDIQLWENLRGGTVWNSPLVSIGMKHGIGKCGGFAHIDHLERYSYADAGFIERSIKAIDPESFEFYQQFAQ